MARATCVLFEEPMCVECFEWAVFHPHKAREEAAQRAEISKE